MVNPSFVPQTEEEQEAVKSFFETGNVGVLNNSGLAVVLEQVTITKIVRLSDLEPVENGRISQQ